MPNKTIYVSDGDLTLYQRAQELAGGNLSSAISKALRRFVDVEESLLEGFDEITVRVGVGTGRKVRFTGVLVGEWMDTRDKNDGRDGAPRRVMEHIRVFRGRTGRFVVHVERSGQWWTLDAEGKPAVGWRSWLGLGDLRYGSSPAESTLEVVETLEDLQGKLPPELFDMVARSARQPTVEQLDL